MREADLALLRDAAEEAGRIAARHFRRDPEVWDKGDGQGPVTEADLAINAMLKAELRAARPDYGWLSEESEDNDARLGAEHVFIVDPIDGTRAFIEGSTSFSTSLAVARRGVVTAAVVALPMKSRVYAAMTGAGATLNGAAIRASDPVDAERADVLAARANLDPRHWPAGVPGFKRHFRSSIAYRLSLVGHGRFDAMLTFRRAWEWDVAAGALIVEEASGRVSDQQGAPLRFNNPHPMVPGVVAAGPALHADLISRL